MKQKARALVTRLRPAAKLAKMIYQNRKVELSLAASLVALVRSFVH